MVLVPAVWLEEIQNRRLNNISREGTSNYMNNHRDILVIHQNGKRTSVSEQLGNYEACKPNKALVSTLLSGRPMEGSNHSLTKSMSTLRNSGELNVRKPKLQSRENTEVNLSSSQTVHNLKNEIPLILHSKEEIQKEAESAKVECTENYRPPSSYQTVDKPTKTLELHLSSAVNSTTRFEVSGTSVLNMDIAKAPYKVSRISLGQVGTIVDPNNPFAVDGVLVEQHIGGGLTKGRDTASNQPKESYAGMEDITGSASPSESLEARQPSPVSVLEPSLERESLCYKRDIADPHELQKQLGLLKFELDRVDEPQITTEPLHLIEDIKLEFTCEEERDFSYLLDMLIDSGFHSATNEKKLLRICYDRYSPVGPTVFSNLEKKYKKIRDWSLLERKLLFDLANSFLAEILAPCMELRPWAKADRQLGPMWGQEGLVEKLWQILARKRELLPKGDPLWQAFDIKWIKLGDQTDLIAREIERSIKDELLEELVLEYLLE